MWGSGISRRQAKLRPWFLTLTAVETTGKSSYVSLVSNSVELLKVWVLKLPLNAVKCLQEILENRNVG